MIWFHSNRAAANWIRKDDVKRSLSPTLTVIKLLVLCSSCLPRFILTFHASPHALPTRCLSRDSRWACERALIEANINLRVTNSSCTRVGAGACVVNCCVVKPGPPGLLCPPAIHAGTAARPHRFTVHNTQCKNLH